MKRMNKSPSMFELAPRQETLKDNVVKSSKLSTQNSQDKLSELNVKPRFSNVSGKGTTAASGATKFGGKYSGDVRKSKAMFGTGKAAMGAR
jgi:hypothetical protein